MFQSFLPPRVDDLRLKCAAFNLGHMNRCQSIYFFIGKIIMLCSHICSMLCWKMIATIFFKNGRNNLVMAREHPACRELWSSPPLNSLLLNDAACSSINFLLVMGNSQSSLALVIGDWISWLNKIKYFWVSILSNSLTQVDSWCKLEPSSYLTTYTDLSP